MKLGFHVVQPGDELFRILRSVYGDAKFLAGKDEMVAYVRANNPDITDINRIYPGQVIVLPTDMAAGEMVCKADRPPPSMSAEEVAATGQLRRQVERLAPEQAAFLSRFGTKALENSTTEFVKQVEILMGQSERDLARAVRTYWSHKSGLKTRGQYDYARGAGIKKTADRMGKLERLAMTDVRDLLKTGRTNTTREVFRIDRTATRRTHKMVGTVKDLRRISKVSKLGKRVLFWAGPAFATVEIAIAEKPQDRVGILADLGGGMAGGVLGGAGAVALTVLVLGTPAGWVATAAVLAVGGLAGSTLGGTTAEWAVERAFYDSDKSWIDQMMD